MFMCREYNNSVQNPAFLGFEWRGQEIFLTVPSYVKLLTTHDGHKGAPFSFLKAVFYVFKHWHDLPL